MARMKRSGTETGRQLTVLDLLLGRGWTKTMIARRLGVRPATVTAWHATPVARASNRTLRELERLLSEDPAAGPKPSGRMPRAERAECLRLARQYGLATPNTRADKIRKLLKVNAWTQQDLAVALGVSLSSCSKYLDPNRVAAPPLTTMRVLCALIDRTPTGARRDPANRYARILGKIFGLKGKASFLKKRSRILVAIRKELQQRTGLSYRTILRYVPPGPDRRPPGPKILKLFEDALGSRDRKPLAELFSE